MKAAFAACGLALSFTSPTWAQSPPPRAQAGGVLPPHEVLTSVRSMGLDPVGRPALRGRVYVLRAFDDTQFEKRVVVDARSGAVLSVRDAISSSPAYTPYDPRYGRYEPPRPPASIARAEPPPDMEPLLDEPLFPRSARVAPAPGREVRSAAVNPRTPLPKMRPAAATTTQDAAASPQSLPPTSSPAPAAVAAAPAATPSPTPLPSADALAAASSSPGKSIPAPVASHAYVGSRTDAPEKPPAEKSVTQLVPVAPLE